MRKVSPPDLGMMKLRSERFVMITAYDYTMASLAAAAEVPVILVGDSMGMVSFGHATTHKVTMRDVIRASQAVARGAPNALVVADMPFMSYQVSSSQAVKNAGLLLSSGEAQAVKLEGGSEYADTVRYIVRAGIPVMGHVGFTPQSVHSFGGYKVQGKNEDSAQAIVEDALAVQEAGAFAIVVELVPDKLAATITDALAIPTIGIGAGGSVDAQVQVITDMLGMDPNFRPKHARVYTDLAVTITDALRQFNDDVKSGRF